MIDINEIRKNSSGIIASLAKRGEDLSDKIEKIKKLDEAWRTDLLEMEEIRREKNTVSDEIGKLKRNGSDASEMIEQMQKVSAREKEIKKKVDESRAAINQELLLLPNIPDDSVTAGNKVLREQGEQKKYDFEVLPHWEAGKILNILDFEKAAVLSGSQFPLLCGDGALLERALINFMLDVHIEKHGYLEIMPPYLVREETMIGTGKFPKFSEESYMTVKDGLCLIPTAEVPLVNLVRDKILSKDELPLKYAAFTSCFRREAGSHGLDTKGLIRNHQFNKVELVNITNQEESGRAHEQLLAESEEILKLLQLPYRVLELGSDDMGFAAAKTYDLEVWMPGEKKWREVSSCSNCLDFQARRINARYRSPEGDILFVHTLNSSGLAVGRIFAAIVENFQTDEINVKIPEALQSYMKGRKRIKRPDTVK